MLFWLLNITKYAKYLLEFLLYRKTMRLTNLFFVSEFFEFKQPITKKRIFDLMVR